MGIWKNEASLKNISRAHQSSLGRLTVSSQHLFSLDFAETSSSLIMFNLQCRQTADTHKNIRLHWELRELKQASLADRLMDFLILLKMPYHPSVVIIQPLAITIPLLPQPRTHWKWHCLSPPGHSALYIHPHLLSSIPHNHSLTESFPEQLLFSTKTELITPTFVHPHHFVSLLTLT